MKKIFILSFVMLAGLSCASGMLPVVLPKPDMKREATLMEALSGRQSIREFDNKDISSQDLSDLLWAANGINRPDGKRTAPSAMNRQDIKLYVLTIEGSYYYDPQEHILEPVMKGDFRQAVRGNIPVVNILVVADDGEARFADVDAGYVSQNIYLFCSAAGLATVACGSMDADAFRKACDLNDKQRVVVHHPVGYPKK